MVRKIALKRVYSARYSKETGTLIKKVRSVGDDSASTEYQVDKLSENRPIFVRRLGLPVTAAVSVAADCRRVARRCAAGGGRAPSRSSDHPDSGAQTTPLY